MISARARTMPRPRPSQRTPYMTRGQSAGESSTARRIAAPHGSSPFDDASGIDAVLRTPQGRGRTSEPPSGGLACGLGPVAQRLEPRTHNPSDPGSNPGRPIQRPREAANPHSYVVPGVRSVPILRFGAVCCLGAVLGGRWGPPASRRVATSASSASTTEPSGRTMTLPPWPAQRTRCGTSPTTSVMTSTPRTGAPWLRRSNFEQALGVHVLGRRALSHEDDRADPEGWVSKLRTERSGELAAYGLRLVRMPAGQLAKELDLAASVTEDVAAIVKRRNHLAHRWFPEYFPRRGQEGARDSAIRELRELETDLRSPSLRPQHDADLGSATP